MIDKTDKKRMARSGSFRPHEIQDLQSSHASHMSPTSHLPGLLVIAIGCFSLAAQAANPDQPPKVLEQLAIVGINTVLSQALGVPVTIGRMQLDLKSQFLEIRKINIGNPKRFSSPHAIAVDDIRVEADIKSLFSESPLIHLIQVSGASVNAEVNSHGINLKKLMDHSKPKGHKPPPKKHEPGAEKRFRIEKVLIEDGALDVTTELFGKNTMHKSLDHLEMSLMGEDGNGVTANEAVSTVLQALVDKAGLLDKSSLEQLGGPLVNLLGN